MLDLGARSRTLIIAEAGVNHNGSLDLAMRLVDAGADAGADMVKFQTYRAEALVSRHAEMADYQKRNLGHAEAQFAMLKRLELDAAAHLELVNHCRRRDITFLSTPFDLRSADFLLEQLGLDRLKISSGDLGNAPFLHALARRQVPLILSSGMALLGDIEQALGVLAHGYLDAGAPSAAAFREAYLSPEGRAVLRSNISLLHCTTEYPTAPHDVNLRAISTLSEAFGLVTGYSDHSEGIAVPIAATALGAAIIEKHFTLDRTMEGPDHKASLEPHELIDMVRGIRTVEVAVGHSAKVPTPIEEANRRAACKSIVAIRDIAPGDIFSAENIACKRPGTGLPPIQWWDIIGQAATRGFKADEVIVP